MPPVLDQLFWCAGPVQLPQHVLDLFEKKIQTQLYVLPKSYKVVYSLHIQSIHNASTQGLYMEQRKLL